MVFIEESPDVESVPLRLCRFTLEKFCILRLTPHQNILCALLEKDFEIQNCFEHFMVERRPVGAERP
jgi:hypothetical protein